MGANSSLNQGITMSLNSVFCHSTIAVSLLLFVASGTAKAVPSVRPATSETEEVSGEIDLGRSVTERLTNRLGKLVPQAAIGTPEKLPIPGVFQVQVGRRYVYVTDDGRYAFVGDLLDLENGTNLTSIRRGQDTLAIMSAFPQTNMVVYPANGDELAVITVFTDTSCPYCRKFHAELSQLQRAGVTVRYIAFPRAGTQGEAYQTMRRVWCADDRRKAMNRAKGDGLPSSGAEDCAAASAVDAGYQLGLRVGIRGTPAIVLPNGNVQPGYLPSPQLLTALGLGDGATRASKATPNK